MIGESVLHYKIPEKLGEGGMGVVYLFENTKLKSNVTFKLLPHHISTNEEQKRFEIEKTLQYANLNSDNFKDALIDNSLLN